MSSAVHIDKTARPQIVDSKSHPFVYSVISNMHKKYGDLSIINTSFNLHEEPIVCSPYDAIKALKQNAVDKVIFDNMIISMKPELVKILVSGVQGILQKN